MAVGIFLIVIFVFVPYFTLGSDIKMLKDAGLNLILVLCMQFLPNGLVSLLGKRK